MEQGFAQRIPARERLAIRHSSKRALWFAAHSGRDKPRDIFPPFSSLSQLQRWFDALEEGVSYLPARLDSRHVLLIPDQADLRLEPNRCTDACGWPVPVFGDVFLLHFDPESGELANCNAEHDFNPFIERAEMEGDWDLFTYCLNQRRWRQHGQLVHSVAEWPLLDE